MLDELGERNASLIADSIERRAQYTQSDQAAVDLLQRLQARQGVPTPAQKPISPQHQPRPALTVEEKADLFVLFREHLFGQIEKEVGEFVRETTAELRAEFDRKLDELRTEVNSSNETAWRRLRSIWR